MDTLYTFGDDTTHYNTESLDFWGLMNSGTTRFLSSTLLPFLVWGLLIKTEY